MKQFRKLTIIFLFACSLAFYSCADWLSIHPRDQVLEELQFSTELRINSALNGIYRAMAQDNLYGEFLTQTYIEYLARYYNFVNTGVPIPALVAWSLTARFDFTQDEVRRMSQNIWNSAYRTILDINVFIDNVSTSDAVRESRRDVLLGEAYALRAFLHFDMFRLFGPVMKLDPDDPLTIPFSDSRQVISRDPLPAAVVIERILRDLTTAERLLENDPIRTRGVNDNYPQVSRSPGLTSETIFAEYFRNRRMNYYAVRALRARVLLHARRFDEAAALAAEVLEEATRTHEGDGRFFQWETDWAGQIIPMNNFVFYNEVLFGISNPNLHTNWVRLFDGTTAGTHVFAEHNLFANIFADFPIRDLITITQTDIRAGQFRQSNIPPGVSTGTGAGHTFISTKFRRPAFDYNSATDHRVRYLINFQPLIRLSELLFIQAEAAIEAGDAALAAEKINYVRARRRGTAEQLLPPTAEMETIQAALMREVYREFVGEGQAFFFLKRNAKTRIFSGFNQTQTVILEENIRSTYVVPLPDSETIVG